MAGPGRGPPPAHIGSTSHHLDPTTQHMSYRLWVNDQRTVLVHMWPDGHVDVALRDDPSRIWGPPIDLTEESIKPVFAAGTGQPDAPASPPSPA